MALSYISAIAALLNNGEKQVLPISMANLIELSKEKEKFGTGAQSVQDALSYLAGSFKHADDAAKAAQDNAYAYVNQEIGKLDVEKVGSDTDKDHNKFISYIYQEDGKIKAFAQDMTAANVAYSGTGRTTVAEELTHINSTIAENLTATTLKLVTTREGKEVDAESVIADGTEYQLKQGTEVVAKFNIEKDSFVKSGSVVWRGTGADGNIIEAQNRPSDGIRQDLGYFIKLEIRTSDDTGKGEAEKTLYIPAESLVDAYKANNAGNNVTITIDQNNNTISAKINAGGVGTTELAASAVTTAKIANDAVETAKIKDAAVTTAKIADKNVTKAKLADDVQASLGKADTAVQQIATGTTAGTISVDGKDVKVKDIKAIATTGAAADVTVSRIAELDAIAGYNADTHVDDVQEALAKLAVKVKAINDGAVTSVKTNVLDNGKDTQNAVTISMTPTEANNGAVTVELTHNLGSAAALDYDMKDVTTPVSADFWDKIQTV